jgi:hypothetical protein
MSIHDHLDVVQAVYAAQKPDPTEAGLLNFLLRVIAALPAEEHAGLLRKNDGENITVYPPAGIKVSLSRLCYPDGAIYKVLADAGASPNSGNFPAWTDNGVASPTRYVPVAGGTSGGGGVGPTGNAYAGDASSIEKYGAMIAALAHDYAEAGTVPNEGMGVWFGRFDYDATHGFTREASLVKHRAVWRAALGLR